MKKFVSAPVRDVKVPGEPGTRKLLRMATVVVILLFGVLLFQRLRLGGQHDFMPFYLGAKLASTGQIARIYDESAYQPWIAELRRQGERMSRYDAHYFIRPAFEAFFYIPFTWFPYREASLLALLGNFGLLGILVWKLPVWFAVRPPVRAVLRCALAVYYPFLWSMSVGQDTLLLTLLVACALLLESNGHGAAAGVALGLCVWKPHLIWLLPLALLSARRWRMAAYSLGVSFGLMALSFGLVGLAGFRQWLVLVQAPSSDIKPFEMGNIRALNIYCGPWVAAIAIVLTIACFYTVLRQGAFSQKVSAAILTALLVSPHTYWQDYSLVAIVAMLTDNTAVRILLLLPWPFLYPGRDLLPMIFVALGCMTGLGARIVHVRARSLKTPALAEDPQV